MDDGDDGTSKPVVPPTDTWGANLTWLKDNLSAAIAILTALGFAMGGVILAAFAGGLGVGVTDLGLDLRATVALAAGTLVYPVLVVSLWLLREPQSDSGLIALNAGLLAVMFTITWWWFFDVSVSVWVLPLMAALGAGAGAWRGYTLVRVRRKTRDERPSLPALRLWGAGNPVPALLAGFGLAAVLLTYASWTFGYAVRDDSASVLVPRIIQFVLPVTRGTVTVGTNAVCVDRVGTRVMSGKSSSAVVPEWDGFVIEDCERGDVSDLFEQPPP